MRLIGMVLIAAVSLPMAAAAQSRGDEAGTLKGVRTTPPPGASKAKPRKGTGLMEEEGIFFKGKPAGGIQSKPVPAQTT